ncbi:tyrosine-type recombinase/integrase [Nitrospirillum amazonense]|uniref:tyrosine-type recombinase/integrase n=1 Tax=Nitrospirillum amazonense TaxID=28077 RepID=UPI00241261C4|nr:site-specific integrase [Nitrospirillum amazonense]MDG3440155.1 tyrosine-type recombinase/integrase [Nitrospirillum amazonense]
MARVRLTTTLVDELQPPEKGQSFVWDSEVAGFAVRATASGAKAWVVQMRVRGGKERRMVIGFCHKLPLDKARQEARKVIAAADLGRDPAQERREAREVKPDTNPTLTEFAERWMEEVAGRRNRAGTIKNRRLLLKNHILPHLGEKRLGEIGRRDIEDMHHRVSQKYPVAANRAVSLCSALFATAERWGLLTENPAAKVERNTEEGRERYLTPEEIARLRTALDQSPAQDSADVVRLLLLTGARVGEVLAMRWDQTDLAAGVWSKPAATTKQNKTHRVPLSPAVVEVLAKRQQAAKTSPWVFPGREGPAHHMTTVRTFWAAVCKRAGIQAVRIHDLRHTFASLLVSSGESLPVVGALLGHTQAKTTSRYAHLLDDPLRRAAERVAAITSGGKL